MSAHTPGEWHVFGERMEPDGFMSVAVSVAADTKFYRMAPVAIVLHRNGTMSSERDANARLIAAAPELLEALRELLIATDESGIGSVVAKARAALAKAEGDR